MRCGGQPPAAPVRGAAYQHALDAGATPVAARPPRLGLPIGQAEWIERFTTRLSSRDGGETRESLARLAQQLWPRQALMPPERAADAEYAQWPKPAAGVGRAWHADADHGVTEQVQGFSAE